MREVLLPGFFEQMRTSTDITPHRAFFTQKPATNQQFSTIPPNPSNKPPFRPLTPRQWQPAIGSKPGLPAGDHNQLQAYYNNSMNGARQFLKRFWEGRQVVVDYWRKSPSTKIILINSGVYCLWKLRLIPEDFLVKHFSAERFNLEGGRLHTLLTYSFSHMGIFSLALDMLMVGLMGRAIQTAYGNKYVYWLYGLGAVFGGLSSSAFQRPSPYVQPQVGAESVVAAYLTFLGLLNPHQTFMLFLFPVRAWVLLLAMGSYSLVFDPQKKIFAGMTAGLTVYQMMRVGFL